MGQWMRNKPKMGKDGEECNVFFGRPASGAAGAYVASYRAPGSFLTLVKGRACWGRTFVARLRNRGRAWRPAAPDTHMEPITIRRATIQDLASLQQIGRQTFRETFAATNSAQNMEAYLAESFAEARLRAELTNPHSAFYLAEAGGAVVGYLKVNTGPAQTEAQAAEALEIERIYVLQAYHGQRVGQQLYDYAMRLAAEAGAGYVWLGVWEANQRAIRFYQKNGFVAFGQHVFTLGDDAQTDIMMKRPVPAV